MNLALIKCSLGYSSRYSVILILSAVYISLFNPNKLFEILCKYRLTHRVRYNLYYKIKSFYVKKSPFNLKSF